LAVVVVAAFVEDAGAPAAGVEFVARLDRVRLVGHNFRYGVGEDMDFLPSESGGDEG
jgi:hypothetical protein